MAILPRHLSVALLLGVILSLSIVVKAQQTSEALTVEGLATRLVEESSGTGRDALLSVHGSLVGAPLAQALLIVGRDARNSGSIERARRAYETMADVAVRANAPAPHALALNNIGLLAYDQGDYQDALDWYAKSLEPAVFVSAARIHDRGRSQ